MTLLNQHQAVGIVALSNGLSESQRQTIEQLEVVLAKLGLEMKWPASLFKAMLDFCVGIFIKRFVCVKLISNNCLR